MQKSEEVTDNDSIHRMMPKRRAGKQAEIPVAPVGKLVDTEVVKH
ncbi:MAG: hypothetical protein ABSH28_06720 [Acidobacteriota bacterium]